jgi:hypothetical protein
MLVFVEGGKLAVAVVIFLEIILHIEKWPADIF